MAIIGARFSYLEYQVLMLSLAGVICASLFVIEVAMRRFQVLPLLFPGMFTIRERRFFFFNFDISDGTIGKKIRSEAKMLIRITICVVLSYLWEHCVLETKQTVGSRFPKEECEGGHDCFASTLHFVTFFNHHHEDVQCGSEPKDFEESMVVSCIRFIPPSGTNWLMHLAISHSITQLNLKAFELMVWVGGNSKWVRRLMVVLIIISLGIFIGLFFGGVLSGFVSSWLSFVMSLSVPAFLYVVWQNATLLSRLWQEDAEQVQKSIEAHLHGAFEDIESTIRYESVDGADAQAPVPSPIEKPARRSKHMRIISNLKGALSSWKITNSGKRQISSGGCSSGDESDGCGVGKLQATGTDSEDNGRGSKVK